MKNPKTLDFTGFFKVFSLCYSYLNIKRGIEPLLYYRGNPEPLRNQKFIDKQINSQLEIRSIGRCPSRSGSPTRDLSLDPLSLAVRQGKQHLVASLRESVIPCHSVNHQFGIFSPYGLRYTNWKLTPFPLLSVLIEII